MIVVTNGVSDFPNSTQELADAARGAGIKVFAVGITLDGNSDELLAIAGGDPSLVFTDDWFSLQSLLRPLSQLVCTN